MVPCHATSCVSPFDHLPYGRARRSGSRPRLRAPFAPPPAHQYLPGSDDRGRCSVKRTAIILAAALAVTTARCGRGYQETAPAPSERPAIRSVRITMAALHQAGGVPPGWRFTVPPGDIGAGRRTFADAGYPSCHRVAREAFPPPTGPGPELTGMGSHHPAEYFVESILTPDAVLVDGPGYIGPDGRSVMPSYPDLTLRQLTDLVAYLKSLTAGGAAEMLTAAPPAPVKDLPAPPAEPTTYYYVQAYDVLPGRLAEFEAWSRDEGARAFLAHDGLVRVDTWVDTTRDGPSLVTVLGFRDEDALERFLDDPAPDLLGQGRK